MNKENPVSVPSEDPLVKANDELMAAIAKYLDTAHQEDKSVEELLKEIVAQEFGEQKKTD